MRQRLLHVLVVALLHAACSAAALAQVLSAPSPIGFPEFSAAVRERGGGIDPRGWDALRIAYARYLDGCEALRTGPDAATFRNDLGDRARGGDHDVRRIFTDGLRRLRPQRDLDSALVEAAIAQLPEVSLARGAVLRTWCERRWLLQVSSWNDRSAGRWLPGELRRCRLSTEDSAVVRVAMDELEARLVVLERKRLESVPRCWQGAQEARAHLPPRPEGDGDDEAMQQWWRARRVTMRHAWSAVREVERAIDEAVDQSVASLLPNLTTPGKRAVMAAQLHVRFSDLQSGDPADQLGELHTWLRRADIPAPRRAEAQAMLEVWRDLDDRATADLIRVARQWSRARFADEIDPRADGEDRNDAFEVEVAHLAEKRSMRAHETASQISAKFAIGEAPPADGVSVDEHSTASVGALFAGLSMGWDGENDGESDDVGEDDGGLSDTMWIEAPPRAQEIASFAERFQIDPVRRAVFETLHADLVASWTERVLPLLDGSGRFDMYRPDGGLDLSAPMRIAAAGRAVRDAAIAVKQEFFDGVALVALPDERDAVATWRLSALLGSPSWAMRHRAHLPSGDGNHSVTRRHGNVPLAVRESDLSPSDRAIAEYLVAERASALEAAGRALDDAEVTAHVTNMESAFRLSAAHRSGGDAMRIEEATQAFSREVEQIGKRLVRVAADRIALKDLLTSDLASRLPAEAANRIRRTQLKLCYPELESDRKQFLHVASRALALATLDPERTARVAEAIERWRDAYDALTDRLADLGPEPLPDVTGKLMPRAQHEQQTSWLRFRRDQTGAEMLHDLTIALTEAERREVSGLPKL